MTIVLKQTLAMAGLVGNKNIKRLDVYTYVIINPQINPVYKVPNNMMNEVEGKDFLVNKMMKRSDGGRQGGCHRRCWFSSSLRWFSTISVVKREVERAGLMTTLYRRDSTGSCSDFEVGSG